MDRATGRIALASTALAALVAVGGVVEAQQVYRYIDANGRTVYTDLVPPATAKSVESRQLRANTIETDQQSLEAQRAHERFPVTLYTFACGEICDRAEALLNKRGVPYTTVIVTEATGAERLRKLTGEAQAPVLQAGEKLVSKGFNDVQWQSLLDSAGYPKTPPLRRPQPVADAGKNVTVPPAAAPAATPAASRAAGGYPKD